jgi:hypothetical protein
MELQKAAALGSLRGLALIVKFERHARIPAPDASPVVSTRRQAAASEPAVERVQT